MAHGLDEEVGAGSAVVVLEAMKMEHELLADGDCVVRRVEVAVGAAAEGGQGPLGPSPRWRWIPMARVRTWRRCASATRSAWTARDRTPSPAGASAGAAR